MGRYIVGDINLKLWFTVQNSNAADQFGVTGVQPEELYYYFGEEDLPKVEERISELIKFLGKNKNKMDKFFKESDSYNDEALAKYLGTDVESVKFLLSHYADLELGIKIRDCIKVNDSCEFTAEL